MIVGLGPVMRGLRGEAVLAHPEVNRAAEGRTLLLCFVMQVRAATAIGCCQVTTQRYRCAPIVNPGYGKKERDLRG